MVNLKQFLEVGQKFHGHKCPAMPLGLRAGAAAMNRLGVERSPDAQLVALVELGEDHCAICFGDGIQVITGCTFGKGNIKKLNSFVCDRCGEMTVEGYGRPLGDKKVCIPCYEEAARER